MEQCEIVFRGVGRGEISPPSRAVPTFDRWVAKRPTERERDEGGGVCSRFFPGERWCVSVRLAAEVDFRDWEYESGPKNDLTSGKIFLA